MRRIKFKGITYTDKIVYGSYIYTNYVDIGPIHEITDEYGAESVVLPETVAQLVGVDSNGNEIYEGDALVDEQGFEYVAELQPMVYWRKFDSAEEVADIPRDAKTMPIDFAKRFTKLTLKEKAHDKG